MSRIGEIVSLVRQYGLRRCAYRAVHDAARRTGLLKRRFPAWAWAERPLAAWLRPGVPVDPDGYVAWRGAAGAPFFFAAGRLPHLRAEWAAGAIETAEAILGGDFPYFSGRAEHLGYPEPDWFAPASLWRDQAYVHADGRFPVPGR